jgi:hypothetical protein
MFKNMKNQVTDLKEDKVTLEHRLERSMGAKDEANSSKVQVASLEKTLTDMWLSSASRIARLETDLQALKWSYGTLKEATKWKISEAEQD